jgi:hypothetical protein
MPLMESKSMIFQTQKAFYVTDNGVRKYCEWSINQMTSNALELLIQEDRLTEFCVVLSSIDGFKYVGKTSTNSGEYEFSLNCFMHKDDVRILGTWQLKNITGEFCIHAVVQRLVFKDLPKLPNDDYLAAAA